MNRQNIGKGILIIIEALLLCAVLVLGILTMMVGEVPSLTDNKKPQWNKGTESGSEVVTPGTEEITYTEVRLTFSTEVEGKLASMTTEEKVAQLFLISAESLTGVDRVTISGNGTKTAIEQYPVGGLIYDADNFMGPEQTQLLIANAQGFSNDRIGLPLFMVVEEEGGKNYSPLAVQNKYEITPSPGELAAFADVDMVTSAVNGRMEYLTAAGFNMVFGPMANLGTGADLSTDDRTYGKDSTIATTLIAADVAATNAADVSGVLRYFPRVRDEGDFDELTKEELSVFQSGIDAGAKVIMVSHSKAGTITGDKTLPCSLASGTVATLRGKVGYEGVLMTAPLNDESITSSYDAKEAAVKAIVAGMDMIYEPTSFVEAYEAVLAAVNDGTISQMRLENAVGKVLEMKME